MIVRIWHNNASEMHNLNNTVQAQRSAVTGKQYAICVSERRDLLHMPIAGGRPAASKSIKNLDKNLSTRGPTCAFDQFHIYNIELFLKRILIDFERSELEKDFERSDLLKKGVPHRDALWMNMPLSGRITSRQVS